MNRLSRVFSLFFFFSFDHFSYNGDPTQRPTYAIFILIDFFFFFSFFFLERGG
jgi:bacteriorhodopsin